MTSPATARIAKRLKIFEPAFMHYGRVSDRIHLLDISYTGALVHGGSIPPPYGTIVRKDFELAARVVWVRSSRFGIAFLKPILETELAQLIEVVPSGRLRDQIPPGVPALPAALLRLRRRRGFDAKADPS